MSDKEPPGVALPPLADKSAGPPGRELEPTKPTVKYKDEWGIYEGAVRDYLGLTARPGARTGAKVLLEPEGALERVGSAAFDQSLMVPASVYGGAGGRIGAASLIGGAKEAGRRYLHGEEQEALPVLGAAAMHGAGAGLGEGVLGAAAGGLKYAGASARGFANATEAPARAFKAVADRLLGVTKINVPSLGGKLAPSEAVEKLSKLTGEAWQRSRQEIGEQLNALDRSGFAQKAGDLFWQFVPDKRFTPKMGAQWAEVLRRAVSDPKVRAAVDASLLTPLEDSPIPVGAVAAAGLASNPATRKIPYVGEALEALEDSPRGGYYRGGGY